METFVLLPFFLLSRVPTDPGTWRYGPEYTFVTDANLTVTEAGSTGFPFFLMHSTLKCRPRDSETLHCQFGKANLTIQLEPKAFEDEDNWFHEPFDIKFDRWGIQSLVIPRDVDTAYLNMARAFVSQISIGVELLHKQDGAFQITENAYIGKCESLVNVSRKMYDDDSSEKEDYEIIPMTGIKKQRDEVLVIEKTRNLKSCVDKRDYAIFETQKHDKLHTLSSYSRIVVSDTDYVSYTENIGRYEKMKEKYSVYEKIRLNLDSILPAKEPLEPVSNNRTTVSPYVHSE